MLLTVRTLALPLLGWDTLTYHGVKAGMWVQTGGWTTLIAPGGWESCLTFFGGGEAFTAWAMLFLHCDLFAGIPDVFFWGLLGLMTTCLANEFGLPVRTAALVGLAFLCAVDLSRMVGSGYVDIRGNAFLLGGVLFLVRFARSKESADFYMAAAAFGLASSVKVNMLASSVLMGAAGDCARAQVGMAARRAAVFRCVRLYGAFRAVAVVQLPGNGVSTRVCPFEHWAASLGGTATQPCLVSGTLGPA